MQIARRIFGRDGNNVGHCAAKAEAREETQGEQFVERGRASRECCEKRKRNCRGDDHPLAAPAVGNRAADHCGYHQAKQTRTEYGPKCFHRNVQALGNRGSEKSRRLRVKAVENKHGSAQQDNGDLKSPQPALVDNLTYREWARHRCQIALFFAE